MYRITNFFTSIHNLIIWFKVIWNDRDHDYSFIYNILQFKLNKQAQNMIKTNYTETSLRDAELMLTCVNLIELIKTEYYIDELNDLLYDVQMCGEDTISNQLNFYFILNSRMYKLISKNYPDLTPYQIASMIATLKQDKARLLLFNILFHKMHGWWY